MDTVTTKSALPGINILLLGASGVGKTSCIPSFLEVGVTPFCIFSEPSFEVLGKKLCPHGAIHWKYIAPAAPSWADMLDSAKKINTFDFKTLSGMEAINKGKYPEFMDLITAHNNFVCDACKQAFGDVSTWGTDRAIVDDSLSGINTMAMNLVVGSKPMKSKPDWGMAMDNLERFIQALCVNKRCHFMLIGHLDRELDEISGATRAMVATLGQKLAPKLPRLFSDVIMAKRDGTKFTWTTTEFGAELKARNLPYADNLVPSVAPLILKWQERGGIIETPQKATTEEVKQAVQAVQAVA